MMTALLLASVLAVTLPPEPANHIADQAQLLNSQERAQLESTFQTAYQQKGVKLGLLTLSELDDQPKVVAVRTLNYWNMSPDSVLILVSLNPKKIYLQPGENLASTFDERTSTAITRSMVPAMKAGNFGQAVLTAFDGVMVGLGGVNTGVVPQIQRAAPQPQAEIPLPPQRTRPQPVVADPVQVTASAPEESGGHGFLIFLLVVGAVGVIAFLAYRQHKANERRATRRTGGFTPYRSSYDPDTGVKRSSGGSGGGTVVNNVSGGGGSSDLLTGVLVGNMLSQPSAPAQAAPPAPAPVYTPPPTPTPPTPKKSFSERLSDVADSLPSLSSGSSSRGSGGGGSSWGSSSDSGSSYSSGGGGSDWGSSSSGSDSSSGSGGGGSDW